MSNLDEEPSRVRADPIGADDPDGHTPTLVGFFLLVATQLSLQLAAAS
jgi:hypothetical protein